MEIALTEPSAASPAAKAIATPTRTAMAGPRSVFSGARTTTAHKPVQPPTTHATRITVPQTFFFFGVQVSLAQTRQRAERTALCDAQPAFLQVPGCRGGDVTSHDYCFEPSALPVAEFLEFEKETSCQAHDGKRLEHLDRHAVECGPGEALSQWRVVKCQNALQIKYTCARLIGLCPAGEYGTPGETPAECRSKTAACGPGKYFTAGDDAVKNRDDASCTTCATG